MKAKYINPFTDFGFKKVFGEEASQQQLMNFLNSFKSLGIDSEIISKSTRLTIIEIKQL